MCRCWTQIGSRQITERCYAVLSMRPKMGYTVKTVANLRGWEPDDSCTKWLQQL